VSPGGIAEPEPGEPVTEPGAVAESEAVTELGGTGRIGDEGLGPVLVPVSVPADCEVVAGAAPPVVRAVPATGDVHPASIASAHRAAASPAVTRRFLVTAEP
jgi:hypothetical protein